jgi:uncharacterized protein (DUF302 family)
MATPTDNGFVSELSPYSVAETLDRLEALVRAKGMTVFARIDQRAAAETVGLTMRPMQILIFGDPRGGTPLMTEYPSLAIDLPLKALSWEAEGGQVWLSHNSPAYLQQRHGLPQTPFAAVEGLMEKALE